MAALLIAVVWILYGCVAEKRNMDLMRRNEELTDQLLRYQGKDVVFHARREPLRISPGHYDGLMAPSQKEKA